LLDQAIDGLLQRYEQVEHSIFQPVFGELGEEAFDRVEPER